MMQLDVKNAIIPIFKYGVETVSLNKNFNKSETKTELHTPPIKPTRLLFGLAATTPRVLFPNRIPKNHAKESQTKTQRRKKLITKRELSQIVRRERKVINKPQ